MSMERAVEDSRIVKMVSEASEAYENSLFLKKILWLKHLSGGYSEKTAGWRPIAWAKKSIAKFYAMNAFENSRIVKRSLQIIESTAENTFWVLSKAARPSLGAKISAELEKKPFTYLGLVSLTILAINTIASVAFDNQGFPRDARMRIILALLFFACTKIRYSYQEIRKHSKIVSVADAWWQKQKAAC
ncbi:MAG: hypothetical protein HY394_04580 [Candidatus Diapherotrites archaeon]|nr:hypothetical protein [Candidatus Diapherotrites archaeon]